MGACLTTGLPPSVGEVTDGRTHDQQAGEEAIAGEPTNSLVPYFAGLAIADAIDKQTNEVDGKSACKLSGKTVKANKMSVETAAMIYPPPPKFWESDISSSDDARAGTGAIPQPPKGRARYGWGANLSLLPLLQLAVELCPPKGCARYRQGANLSPLSPLIMQWPGNWPSQR